MMRLLITLGGGMLAMLFCDSLSKTIDQLYLQQPQRSLALTWGGTVILTFLLIASLVFLYRRFGKAAFRWRDSYYPSLGETLVAAGNLPLLVLSMATAFSNANKYSQEPRVPNAATFGFHYAIICLTVALTALVINLGRDLLIVRRLGWRQIELMEAARVKEDGALTLP